MAAPTTFKIRREDLLYDGSFTTLITGGGAGIGLETAQLLHDLCKDNRIIILDRASKAECKAPAAFTDSARVHFEQCDVTDWNSLRSAFDAGVRAYGQIDSVFVNAGINEYGNQLLQDELDSDGKLKEPDHRTLSIDLNAAVNTVKLAIHHLRKTGGGSIVLTASLAGYLASAGAPLYSAAKHGIVGLMRSLKNDTIKLNISISVVAPGITLTDLVAGRNAGETLSEWAIRMRGAGVPINSPNEVAIVVIWLMMIRKHANGKGVLVQAGQIADVEQGLAKNRGIWMGAEQLEMFKGGRNAPLFPNKL